MIEKTTISIERDTKRRLDRIKAELQSDYDTLINQMCEVYENQYRCEIESLKHE